MSDPIIFRAQREFQYDGYGVYIRQRTADGMRYLFNESLEERMKITQPMMMLTPSLILTDAQAQTLFQDLWDSGLRPATGEGDGAILLPSSTTLRICEHWCLNQRYQ